MVRVYARCGTLATLFRKEYTDQMPRSPLLPLADKAFGGGLVNFIQALREQTPQPSWETISRILHDRGIDVSARTLQNWCS